MAAKASKVYLLGTPFICQAHCTDPMSDESVQTGWKENLDCDLAGRAAVVNVGGLEVLTSHFEGLKADRMTK